MDLMEELMKKFGIDRDIAEYVTRHYKGGRARKEALKWQQYRKDGQVTVGTHGIHGSRSRDSDTEHLWGDL